MRRVWRFILALSVTPLMTAGCLAILAWMTWNAAFIERDKNHGWHVGKVVDWLQGNPIRYPSSWPAGVFRRGAPSNVTVIYEKDGKLIESETVGIPDYQSAIVVVSQQTEPQSRSGVFAITREEWTITATLMYNGQVVKSSAFANDLASKCDKHPLFRRFSEAVRVGNSTKTSVRWSGYVYNTAAAGSVLLCLYSLQWIWRGARMPWGDNRSWRSATNSPTRWWWFRRIFLLSPWTQLVLAVVFVVMLMVNRSPRWGWQHRLRYDIRTALSPIHLWNFDQHKVPSSYARYNRMSLDSTVMAPWLSEEEKDQWGRLGIRIPQFQIVLDDSEFPWFAPMTSNSRAVVELLVNSSNSQSLLQIRESFQQLMIDRGVITPEQDPLVWTVQPKRIVWQGVLFNGLMLIVAGAFLASLVWLRDGVVWPWNARRLRQGVCLKCSYSLIGLNAAKCPECGTQVPSPA